MKFPRTLFLPVCLCLMTMGLSISAAQSQTAPAAPLGQEPVLKMIPADTQPAASYYLSLPEGWTAGSTWPILVTLEGSGHNFLQNCQGFRRARGKQPFILVTPCVTSNGNDPADAPAVLSIVRDVQKQYQGQARFFLTGFSAGGHVTWQLVFSHPELLAAVAPCAANFRNRGIGAISEAPERSALPIHAFQGDKDPYVKPLSEQWDTVTKFAQEHGYTHLDRTVVPGVGHSPFPRQVIDYFVTLLPRAAEKDKPNP